MERPARVAVLEPYYGGSHAGFIEAWRQCSRHELTVASLPARKWKWRMRGSAIWFAQQWREWADVDGPGLDAIFCNDMLSVADLRALLPDHLRELPIICYFHEIQLTYPLQNEEERDYQYGMTNLTSCLAADAVWFNSRFHLDGFLAAGGALLRRMPDFVPGGVTELIKAKADVSPPPVVVNPTGRPYWPENRRATILWCHRWEYDKNPKPFFEALLRLDSDGREFDLVMLGEQFREAPAVFADAWPRLQAHIVHAGFVPDHAEYLSLMSRCDLVVSTAIQENFGVAVVEAILSGCQPLLPARLAYPEVLPAGFHDPCLFDRDSDLYGRLSKILAGDGRLPENRMARLQDEVYAKYGLEPGVERLDQGVEKVLHPEDRP